MKKLLAIAFGGIMLINLVVWGISSLIQQHYLYGILLLLGTVFFTPWFKKIAKQYTGVTLGWGLSGVLGLAVLLLVPNKPMEKVEQDKAVAAAAAKQAETIKKREEARREWIYGYIDEATDKRTRIAALRSVDTLSLKPPYSGGTIGSIGITKSTTDIQAVFSATNGKVLDNTPSKNELRIQFDDSDPKYYSYTVPVVGDGSAVFIDKSSDITRRLKDAKRILIEASFVGNGTHVFHFEAKEALKGF